MSPKKPTPPPGEKKTIQTADDRDAAGLKKLRDRRTGPQQVVSGEIAAPEFVHEDPTKPIELMSRTSDLSDAYREELQAAIERYETDPAYRLLWKDFRRGRRESDQVARRTANAALEASAAALQAPSAEIMERIDKVEEQLHRLDSVLRVAKWILGMCVAGALGAIVTVGLKIYSEGYDKGQLTDRVEHLENTVKLMSTLKGLIP